MKMPLLPGLSRIAARRPALPADAADALGVADERVLAWSPLPGEGLAAGTVQGLRVLTPMGKLIRRPWVDVSHVAWDEDSRTLAVWWVGSRQPLPVELPEHSFLPEVVHERVRSSVLLSRDVPVEGRSPVWVALRQDADGTLSTQAVAPAGVRLDDPELAAAVTAAQAALRAEVGA
jgi:hypothetical protein